MAAILRTVLYRVGFALRESGQALERTGCALQGIDSFEEQLPRLRSLQPFGAQAPRVGSNSFVSPTAAVVGNVEIADNASVWYNCVVRGDLQPVSIGEGSNVQDGACVGTLRTDGHPTVIGRNVSVGHGATLRGCTVEENSLIGIGAVVEDGCTVERGALVAAGAVVSPGTVVPSGELWGGAPAKKLRALKPEERRYLEALPPKYAALAGAHGETIGVMENVMARHYMKEA